MTEWLAEVKSAVSYYIQNPIVFLVAFAIFWLIYRLQARFLMKTMRNAERVRYAGLNEAAREETRRHDTGIGTQTTLVLRPVRASLSVILPPLILFGFGAAFMGLAVLPDPDKRTTENVFAFIGCLGFVGLCGWGLFGQLTRIELFADRIIQKRFLLPRRRFLISDIVDVQKLGKAPGLGVILVFQDGRRLPIPARFAGYRDALQSLRNVHPKTAGFIFLADAAKRALNRTK